MSKKFKKRNAKYRSAVCGLVAIAASFAMFASACADTTTTEEEDQNASTRVDEQTLKNGNFEFFEDNDGTYILGTPDSWSSGTGSSATESGSASGIIGTTATAWNRLTDPELPQAMWDNDALDEDDEDYIDYGGTPFDLPLRDPSSAITENEDDDKDDVTDDYIFDSEAEYIDNPYTHEYRIGDDGETLYDAQGNVVTYYEDEDGNYYTDSAMEAESKLETNVLMIHNWVDDDLQGTQTYFSSSTTLTLEANTAAKLSVWVKTSDLYYGGNTNTRTEVLDQRGAYIEVAQTVGGTALDSFRIENINTERLNQYDETTGVWTLGNNGWVQYTVYVSACNYAETTITLTVGLGEASVYTLEGYAFFDDIEYEKYLSVDAMVEAAEAEYTDGTTFDQIVSETTCGLLDEGEDKVYRVDEELINQGSDGNATTITHYSENYDYHLDLTTAKEDATGIVFDSNNLSAGLTVDDDNYVVSKNEVPTLGDITLNSPDGDTYVPRDLTGNKAVNISEDILANLTVTSSDSWTSEIGGAYEGDLNEALKTAAGLPGAPDGVSTLLMLSVRGAAYESVISDPSFTIAGGEYKIVSFWVKTSELNEKTTVSISVRQVGKTSNSGSMEVDSTTVDAVTINDEENVYKDWVQCYVLVSNTLESTDEDQQFEIVVNYGPTTIKDTTSSSYYPGWVAVTNMSVLTVDETAYGYADTDTRAATITISEESSTENTFDDTFGNFNDIETEMARPSSYNGVNGGSAMVQSGSVEIDETNRDYHSPNGYEYAGLINKDYFETYKETYSQLLTELGSNSALEALFGEAADWNTAVGATSTQPLLIVNTVRTFAKTQVNNYGYIGNSSTVSADSYTAVSVRVKVSQGAIATVYLVDPDSRNPLTFGTPRYTFWYDNDGNVLKGEPAEDASRDDLLKNIAYTLRSDGLYEDENGNLYANLYNLEREYYDEHADYYTEDGLVSFDNLVEGETYYADANLTTYAAHNLVTSAGERVYRYVSGIDGGAVYSYFVDGEPDESKQVKTFDITVAEPRYEAHGSTPYSFTIDASEENSPLANKRITVNFFIRTGSEDKNYRLELWSGTRDSAYTDGVDEGSYVLFDYSAVSLDEDTYTSLLSHYSGEIIEAYRNALRAENPDIVFDSNEENIAYYESLGDKISLYDYEAQYYTYTLYDSTAYIPFNEDTAEEGETGYNYSYGEYSEELAVLKVNDTMNAEGTDTNGSPMLNMFIDYSTLDKDISITSTSDVTEDEEETTPADATNVWLLASSIIMVVAILIAIAVLIFRDVRKRVRVKTKVGKNTYNYKKNRRYVRTYVKEHGETPVNGDENNSAEGEAPAEVPVDDGESTVPAQEGETTTEEVENTSDEVETTSESTEGDNKPDGGSEENN